MEQEIRNNIYTKFEGMKFCRVYKESKMPIGEKWQKKPLDLKSVANNDENYGVLGGHGDYFILDLDKETHKAVKILQDYIDTNTFVVESGSSTIEKPKYHMYFKVLNPDNLDVDRKHLYGESIWFGFQALCANSIHDDTKRPYIVKNDVDIVEVEAEVLNKAIKALCPKVEVKTKTQVEIEKHINKDSNIIRLIIENKELQKYLISSNSISKQNVLFKNMTIFKKYNPELTDNIEGFIIDCGHMLSTQKTWENDSKYINVSEGELSAWIQQNDLKQEFDKYTRTYDTIKKESGEIDYESLGVKTLSYFKKIDRTPDFLVQNLILNNTVNMLFSKPGSLKSMVSLYLAACVAKGEPFYGRSTKQGNVLYIDKENNDQIISMRIQALMDGMKLDLKDKEFLFNDDLILFRRPEELDKIIKICLSCDIKLIIIDTLHRIGNYKENSSDELSELYNDVFKPLTKACGVTILFLHHAGKNDEYRGSSDLEAQVDGNFKITTPDKKEIGEHVTDEYKVQLLNQKYRLGDMEENNMNIQVNFENSLDDVGNKLTDKILFSSWDTNKEQTKTDMCKLQIIGRIRQEVLSRKEIEEIVGSKPDKIIQQLEDEGLIEKESYGKYKYIGEKM